MPDYIAQYRIYLEQEKHASANTVSSYIRDVTQFCAWLPEGPAPGQACRRIRLSDLPDGPGPLGGHRYPKRRVHQIVLQLPGGFRRHEG